MRDTGGRDTGGLYHCRHGGQSCQQLPSPQPSESISDAVGLSLTTNRPERNKLLACSPSFTYNCGSNSYVNGICYLYGENLRLISQFKPSYQECEPVRMDIVILVDGSGSIVSHDFLTVKHFIMTLISKFKGEDVLFAVAQYSLRVRTEFDFNEFRASHDPRVLVSRVRQMNLVTYTPSGMRYVAESLFRAESGAREGVSRVLVVVTDGESNDRDTTFQEAIVSLTQRGVVRYAIGVGAEFDTERAQTELRLIASSPPENYVFRVTNFQALDQIHETLKQRIFAIEGTQSNSNSSGFQFELAQAGFASVFARDSVIFGAVGVNDWTGSLIEVRNERESRFQLPPDPESQGGYFGYSLAEGRRGESVWLAVGSPRYRHTGRVSVLHRERDSEPWTLTQQIHGEQIGGYFGSVVCSVDLNRDGNQEVLLIGSPLYHRAGYGGVVWVCVQSLNGSFACEGRLWGRPGSELGRFGSSLSELEDVNGDGIRDVAVGAPLEDNHRGCVYIYPGEEGGVGPSYLQRIEGETAGGGLQYFGRSLDSGLTLPADRLPRVVVGAEGKALVLRCSPVLFVEPRVSLSPPRLPRPSEKTSGSNNSLSLCFNVTKLTKDTYTHLSGLLSYRLVVDLEFALSRALFTSHSRRLSRSLSVTLGETCVRHEIRVRDHIVDFYRPVRVSVAFSLVGLPVPQTTALVRPVLSSETPTRHTEKIEFEKPCGSDDICVSDLNLSLSFSGAGKLLLVSDSCVNLSVEIHNRGEESIYPQISLRVPPSLSLRKISETDRIQCIFRGSDKARNIECNVSHPLLPGADTHPHNTPHTGGDAHFRFNVLFDVVAAASGTRTLTLTASVSSQNEANETLTDNEAQTQISVIHPINLLIHREDFTQEVIWKIDKTENVSVYYTFKVSNLCDLSLPVSVTFLIPFEFTSGLIWRRTHLHTDPNLANCSSPHSDLGTETHPQTSPCLTVSCLRVECEIRNLSQSQSVTFYINGDLELKRTATVREGSLKLRVGGWIDFDQQLYTQYPSHYTDHLHHQLVTLVLFVRMVDYVPIIAGSVAGGVGLLLVCALILYKIGFFNRGMKNKMEEGKGEREGGDEGCKETLNPPEADTIE